MTDNQQTENKPQLKEGGILPYDTDGHCAEHDSASCVEMPVSVGSTLMTRIIKRDFPKTSQNIYFISVYGRTLLDEKESRKTEAYVAKNIKNSLHEVTEMIKHIEVLIRENSISDLAIYRDSHVETVRITSPLDKEFVDLIHLADRYLLLAHALWTNGAFDNDQHSLYKEVIERKVKSVNESARKMRQVTVEKINIHKNNACNKTS